MPAGQLTTLKLVLRAARLPVVTLFLHTTHEVRCDLCDKPQQQGETDVITFFAGETNEEPVQKSMDVCRDCRSLLISDLLAELGELGHVFGARRSSEQVDS